ERLRRSIRASERRKDIIRRGVRTRRVRRESGQSEESEEFKDGAGAVRGDRRGEGRGEGVRLGGKEDVRGKVETLGTVDDAMNIAGTSMFVIVEYRSWQKSIMKE
ncbi:MAG: hypothetical protein M1830_002214, partial [Pleopsidium flavum]